VEKIENKKSKKERKKGKPPATIFMDKFWNERPGCSRSEDRARPILSGLGRVGEGRR
jgi:hypothetical protein